MSDRSEPDIRVISAGAGSGKTHRLVRVLTDELLERDIRPEAVVATSFTRKAAAELRERVRSGLLAGGDDGRAAERAEAADGLSAAFIGTVNSVCGELVSLYAFEAGLSPSLRVLDEKEAKRLLEEVISEQADVEEHRILSSLQWRMSDFNPEALVLEIVNLARSNGIAPVALSASCDASLAEIDGLLGPAAAANLDAQLVAALDSALAALSTNGDTTKVTQGVRERCEQARASLARGESLAWSEWLALSLCQPGVKSRAAVESVRAAAGGVASHPRLREDVVRATRLVFDLAVRAMRAYAERKRTLEVIDFIDQETVLLELLERADVRADLRDRIDLLLVDEFQDTSPLQLRLFSVLSRLVKRCWWVGDQKQSIYAFRGADPSLMDAAIGQLGTVDTLPTSYRSRPPLVRLTSDIFAPAFALRGIPQERTRLTPASLDDAPDLGPVVEVWRLDAPGRARADENAALVTGVRAFLADAQARVRDPKTGESRRPVLADVAILCGKNDTCADVADALIAAGIPAVVGRGGLLSRPEARLVLAGLRLWLDDDDTQARAEIARLVQHADDPDAFLTELLDAVDALPPPGFEREGEIEASMFGTIAAVRRVLEARESGLQTGLVDAFDRVVEAVEARERCLEWGDSEQRLANLDVLRGLCVSFADRVASGRGAVTLAGLLADLQRLAREGDDRQASISPELAPDHDADTHASSQASAVTVMTWHGAKGLEWPVTVLYELDHSPPPDLCKPRIGHGGAFAFEDPLRGRWIRLWVDPFSKRQQKSALYERFDAHEAAERVREAHASEGLRLLYVGWTRARDRVVLAGRSGVFTKGRLALLGDLVNEPNGEGLMTVTWAAHAFTALVRVVNCTEAEASTPVPGTAPRSRGQRAHPGLWVQPSSCEAVATRGDAQRIGEPPRLEGEGNKAKVGEGIHAFLAADRADLPDPERFALAARVIASWNLVQVIKPRSLLRVGDSLRAWVEKTWPGAVWRREWPVAMRLAGGRALRGTCDLVLETHEGLVVIDHKNIFAPDHEAVEKAASHGGQLAAYGRVLTAATGRPVAATYIHLPLAGLVVPLTLPSEFALQGEGRGA